MFFSDYGHVRNFEFVVLFNLSLCRHTIFLCQDGQPSDSVPLSKGEKMVAHSVPFVGGEEVVQTNPCVPVLTA